MKKLSGLILRLMGWKVINLSKDSLKKCIIIVAPHTSYTDFIIGRLALWALGIKAKFLIKKESFKFPFRRLLLWFGGIPVDRSHATGIAKQVIDIFKNNSEFCLIITPEGTRKYTAKWKRGYYFIAHAAQVPIIPGYIDYKEKTCCVSDIIIIPSGNYEEDFKIIENFYKGRVAKHPERFNLS